LQVSAAVLDKDEGEQQQWYKLLECPAAEFFAVLQDVGLPSSRATAALQACEIHSSRILEATAAPQAQDCCNPRRFQKCGRAKLQHNNSFLLRSNFPHAMV
jgi:hypothetical protein